MLYYAPIKSIKNIPKIVYAHKGISGSQFKIPNSLAITQSDDFKNKKASGKLTNMVVRVKKID